MRRAPEIHRRNTRHIQSLALLKAGKPNTWVFNPELSPPKMLLPEEAGNEVFATGKAPDG